MESMIGKMRQSRTTIYSDASSEVRLQTRPKEASQSGGRGFLDLGNDFGSKRTSQTRRSSQDTRRPQTNSQQQRPRPKPELRSTATCLEDMTVSSSDDELDSIPRMSHSPSTSRIKKETKVSANVGNGKGHVINGVYHEAHPLFQEKKLPNFKKNKKNADGETPPASQPKPLAPSPTPQASTPKSKARISPLQPPSKATTSRLPKCRQAAALNVDNGPILRPDARRDKLKGNQAPLHELSPNGSRPASQASASDDEDASLKTPRPFATASQRPRPRPVTRGAQALKPAPFSNLSPLAADRDKGKGTGKGRDAAAVSDFPAPSPLRKGKAPPGKAMGKARAAVSSNPIEGLSPFSKKVSTLPALERTSSKASVASFPDLSPLSSPAGQEKLQRKSAKVPGSSQAKSAKGRAVIVSESDSTDEDAPKLAPFPMETQVLESIGLSPPGKRTSGVDSGEEGDAEMRRQRKKRREDPNVILAELLRSDEMSDFDEDDLLFLDPNVDPTTLCPWCDEQLPPVPTPHLTSLMDHARRASSPDVRPTNPLGLRAPLGAFVGVCQRHRFESYQVPRAQQMGWPVEIVWERVGPRVEALRDRLQEIVRDVDEDFLPGARRRDEDDENKDEDKYAGRARMGSVFWRDVVKSVRKTGSRQTAGVRGQFASFSKTQPGYYGELGYVIIHQTIYNLFPPTSFDPNATLPLTPTDFIQLILVPEAAVALVMEDLELDRSAAIDTLRDSAEYGVAMFPDDHADGAEAVAAGDQIVMERAKARRKELEEEERLEDELLSSLEVPQQQPESSRGSRRSSRAASRAKTESEVERSRTTRGKRKAQPRSKPSASQASEDDVIMVTDSASSGIESRARKAKAVAESSRPKPRRQTRSAAAFSDTDSVLSDGHHQGQGSSTVSQPARPRPRRIVRGLKPSQNASEGTVKEKENACDSDGADTDVQEPSPPPSNQLAMPYVSWDNKGKVHIRSSIEVSDAEATPRPKQTRRTSSMSSTAATVGVERKALLPLQTARERANTKTRAASRNNSVKWYHSVGKQQAGRIDVEDGDVVIIDAPSRSNPPMQSSSTGEGSSWLLSDSSTPTSSQ